MAEFALIAAIQARVASRADVILGIGDDAALLQPPPGMQLVVAMDTLNAGVHFPDGTAPADIGWKALAVNLSDLAAMGATPAWCTLSLSLPDADAAFVSGFLDGFDALAREHGVALVGGDTTRGPLSISVAVHGFVAPGEALRRSGARVGDDVWISGPLGDAAGALAQWQAWYAMTPALAARLQRPQPRLALGIALRGIASACIDVSDGLLADLGHILDASGLGADLWVDGLLASEAVGADARARAPAEAWTCALAGGDDYELVFTAPVAARDRVQAAALAAGTPVTRIGRVRPVGGERVRLLDAQQRPVVPPLGARLGGFDHFA